MVTFLGVALVGLGLMLPTWMIFRAIHAAYTLERRLAQHDITLLHDHRYNIDTVTLGPPGTQILENVQIVMAYPTMQVGSNQGGFDDGTP